MFDEAKFEEKVKCWMREVLDERAHSPKEERRFELWTVAAAAEKLDVSEHSVRKLIAEGKLPAVRVFTSLRVDSRDVDHFIETAKQRGRA